MSASEAGSLAPGDPSRLGARPDADGTAFSVWAPHASRVDLCLFDDGGQETRLPLPERTDGVWHGFAPDVVPGQRYGYRVHGDWDPDHGRLFNPDKLLLDPYARALDGDIGDSDVLGVLGDDQRPRPGDSAPYTARSVVVGDGFDWGSDRPPAVPWDATVVYEAHVRGLTRLHPGLPPELRGTYAGLGHPAVLDYLRGLGVTSVELLPVHAFSTEPAVRRRGLTNYWGYNTVGYFAPHGAYSSSGTRGEQVTEFRQLVKDLHAAGLEVLLDVVYNHTAEGGVTGPALSLRGYDDGAYYRRDAAGRYADVTGCGNTVHVSEPPALRLVMDSLRYWVDEMHVDGFRFDLAPALLRSGEAVDLGAPFLTAVAADPVLRRVKLIAEPWDASSDGYLVGRFPPPWREWNDRYRDGVRDFWRGHGGGVRALASRFSGSSDLYGDGRSPTASINFVTAHDGFSLRDLVSYDAKHNEANGEDNRDGSHDNRSWNCGVEGETDDPAVLTLRRRQAANLLATLLLSTGVPMITAGDERGRTQRGNNNAFCQDNEVSWQPWDDADLGWRHLETLARRLLALRARHPVLRQPVHFTGMTPGDGRHKDITWLRVDGSEMTEQAWGDASRTTLGAFLAGDALRSSAGQRPSERDSSYLLWMHAGASPVEVTLPAELGARYTAVLRTDEPFAEDDGTAGEQYAGGSTLTLADRTLALFEVPAPPG